MREREKKKERKEEKLYSNPEKSSITIERKKKEKVKMVFKG